MRQVFDDGTYIDTDAAGNIVSYSDNTGAVYGPGGGGSIGQQLSDTLLGGFRNLVYQFTSPPAPVTVGGAATSSTLAGVSMATVLGVVALALGVGLAVKAFAK
jgi:hypothetical protein